MKKFLMKLLWLVILIAVAMVGFLVWQNRLGSLTVRVVNQTKVNLGDLTLGDQSLENKIILPELAPGKSFQTKVVPQRYEGANTLWLAYNDQEGRGHRVVLIGYFEEGYHGRAIARIKAVNDDGTFRVEVQSELRNY